MKTDNTKLRTEIIQFIRSQASHVAVPADGRRGLDVVWWNDLENILNDAAMEESAVQEAKSIKPPDLDKEILTWQQLKERYVTSFMPEAQTTASYHFDQLREWFEPMMRSYKHYQNDLLFATERIKELEAEKPAGGEGNSLKFPNYDEVVKMRTDRAIPFEEEPRFISGMMAYNKWLQSQQPQRTETDGYWHEQYLTACMERDMYKQSLAPSSGVSEAESYFRGTLMAIASWSDEMIGWRDAGARAAGVCKEALRRFPSSEEQTPTEAKLRAQVAALLADIEAMREEANGLRQENAELTRKKTNSDWKPKEGQLVLCVWRDSWPGVVKISSIRPDGNFLITDERGVTYWAPLSFLLPLPSPNTQG